MHDFPTAVVVIAGDFNKLPESSIVASTGFTPIVRQPTRGVNMLDQIYVCDPWVYDAVRVVKSVVKSDHLAVVATTKHDKVSPVNQTTRVQYRRVSVPSSCNTPDKSTSLALLQTLSKLLSTIFTASHLNYLTGSILRERLPSGLAILNTSPRTSSRCCVRRLD